MSGSTPSQTPYGGPSGPYGPPPQGQPPYGAPPKKSHTVRNVFLVLGLLAVLLVGGCLAVVGLAANEVGEEIDRIESEDSAPGGPDNPLEISEGEAFEVSGFDYQGGWSVGTDGLGSPDVEGLRFENGREEPDSAFVEIRFLRGNEVLASLDCSSDEARPGQVVRVTCFSADPVPRRYDTITINDTF